MGNREGGGVMGGLNGMKCVGGGGARRIRGKFGRGLGDRGEDVGDVAGEEFGREEGKSGDHRGRRAGILGNRGDEGE